MNVNFTVPLLMSVKDLQPGDMFLSVNDVFIKTDGVLDSNLVFGYQLKDNDRILCFDINTNILTTLDPELQVRKLKYQLDVI